MPLLTPDVEPLWIARYDYEAGWQLPPHRHRSYFQLIHVVSGSGRAIIGQREVRFSPGHLLFLVPPLRHGLLADGNQRIYTVDTKFRVHHPGLAEACRNIPACGPVTDARIPTLLEAMLAEARRHNELTMELCQGLLQQVILLLLREARGGADAATEASLPASEEDNLCGRMEKYLRENCGARVTQDSLSRALNYSYAHLHACWKRRHRLSPLQALWHYRVERASQLIRYSDYQLKGIAQATGFASVHHFTRVFTRITKLPPARWRARERADVGRGVVLRRGFVSPILTVPGQLMPGQKRSGSNKN